MENQNLIIGFNPAEAEDGFRSQNRNDLTYNCIVSIQPKPKTGLEVCSNHACFGLKSVSIQPKPKTGLEARLLQSLK